MLTSFIIKVIKHRNFATERWPMHSYLPTKTRERERERVFINKRADGYRHKKRGYQLPTWVEVSRGATALVTGRREDGKTGTNRKRGASRGPTEWTKPLASETVSFWVAAARYRQRLLLKPRTTMRRRLIRYVISTVGKGQLFIKKLICSCMIMLICSLYECRGYVEYSYEN